MMLAATALMLAVLSGAADKPANTGDTLSRATELMNAGQLDAALPIVDEALADYQARYGDEKRPIFCGATSDNPLAMTETDTKQQGAVLADGGWCKALFYRGFILNDRKQFVEAATYLERAVGMTSGEALYMNELAYAYQQARQVERSLDMYKRAEAAASMGNEGAAQAARALRGQGYDLIELGKLDEAEAAYRKSLEMEPDSKLARDELDYIAEQRLKRN